MSNIHREKKPILSCFTIGHSDYGIDYFIQLLKKHNINSLIDIRSMPYSQHSPQFNKELLSADLKANNILYIYMGNQLGGRYTNPDLLFQDGKVDYAKVKQTKNFIDGMDKIIQEIKKGCRIALMCSEKDPFDCHRFVLVACELENKGVTVKHILENGDIVLNSELEKKLLYKYKEDYEQFYLFVQTKTKEQALEEALRKRNLDIAFSTSREKK
jgi:uncharacterized protein (DUF488 family)